MDARFRPFLWIAPVVWLGLAFVTFVQPDDGPTALEYAAISLFLATLFGQAILAAIWTALGPLSLGLRLPLSGAWLMVLVLGLGTNLALHNPGGDPLGVVAVIGGCLAGIWMLVLLPLGSLAFWHGMRLRHRSEPCRALQPRDRQFGIRQVMIVTAVVGVLLGAGRAIVVWLMSHENIGSGEPLIFVFLAVAGVVMMVPLLLAALLPRLALPASLVVLVLIGQATSWEASLFQLIPQARGGPDYWHLLLINAFTAAWVLGAIAVLRLGGYGLAPAGSPAGDPSAAGAAQTGSRA
jgi:hypothetical protein